jgi:DNA-binding transcriptional regulator YiaG
MPDFKLTFQEEVRRLARKEVKAASETLAAQQKTIRELTTRIDALEKKQAAAVVPASTVVENKPADVPAEAGKFRYSPKTLQKLRTKYGISQKAVASIFGVTPFTVSHWELGKNRPRPNQIATLKYLMKLGRRKFNALLAEKAPEEFAALKKAAEKKVAKKATKAPKAGKPAKA